MKIINFFCFRMLPKCWQNWTNTKIKLFVEKKPILRTFLLCKLLFYLYIFSFLNHEYIYVSDFLLFVLSPLDASTWIEREILEKKFQEQIAENEVSFSQLTIPDKKFQKISSYNYFIFTFILFIYLTSQIFSWLLFYEFQCVLQHWVSNALLHLISYRFLMRF